MPPTANLNLLWLAILAAVPILAGATFLIERSPADPPWIPMVVLAVALGPALGSLLVGSAWKLGNPTTEAITRMALAEAVAVLGLAYFTIGGPHVVAMGMMAVSLSLLILHRPVAAAAA
jgi:hypothetical protein